MSDMYAYVHILIYVRHGTACCIEALLQTLLSRRSQPDDLGYPQKNHITHISIDMYILLYMVYIQYIYIYIDIWVYMYIP